MQAVGPDVGHHADDFVGLDRSRPARPCRPPAAPGCSTGHGVPGRGSSRTTTTATSGIAADRFRRCSGWTKRVWWRPGRAARALRRHVQQDDVSLAPAWVLCRAPVPGRCDGQRAGDRDRNSPIADQAALASFITDGHCDRHLRRVRLVYQERYDAMRFHFQKELAGAVSLAPATATHLIGWLKDRRGASPGRESAAMRVSRAAAAEDLVVFPLSRYALEPHEDGLILGMEA